MHTRKHNATAQLRVSMKIHVVICSVLFFALTTDNTLAEIDDLSLVEKLRQGGYVVLVRHALTDFSQSDTDPNNLENCATQRNLNQAGRDQSTAIGRAIKSLEIPVGKVYSSLYCRCIDTAELAFGKPETKPGLSSFLFETPEEKKRRVNVIKELLGTSPESKTNTFLVTHRIMLRQASGIELAEGGAAVFKPGGNSQFQFIAKVPSSRWQTMVDAVTEELNPFN